MHRSAGTPALRLAGAALRWSLPGDHESSGWCLRAGDQASPVQEVVWLRATDDDLGPEGSVDAWVEGRLGELDPAPTAASVFLTSRRLERFVHQVEPFEGGLVEVLVTAGLSNALRVGDSAPTPRGTGTINVALRVSVPLEEAARLELLSLVTEAKAAALLEAGVASSVSKRPSTGTGTDCAVVVSAAPGEGHPAPERFAGKHTALGAAVGRVALRALEAAVSAWCDEFMDGCAPLVLVGGGARSGKSGFAEERALALAEAQGGHAVYIATAQAFDDEMAERIARHRADRGEAFDTREVPMELEACLEELGDAPPGAVLVDCLTLWLSNLYLAELDDESIDARCVALTAALVGAPFPVVVVSNEVGLGIVPEHSLSRRFRDAAGRLHQRLSRVADEVHFAAMGTVLRLRPGPAEPSRSGRRGDA